MKIEVNDISSVYDITVYTTDEDGYIDECNHAGAEEVEGSTDYYDGRHEYTGSDNWTILVCDKCEKQNNLIDDCWD